MAKQTKIPDKRGSIQVVGRDKEVKAFKTDYKFYQQLESRIEEGKQVFRTAAAEAAAGAALDVATVEFIADDGSAVPVTLPDPAQAGNRRHLNLKDVGAELHKRGASLDELGVTEISEKVVLTGDWVKWFRDVLANQQATGDNVPDGWKIETVTRLSPTGVQRLKELAKSPDDTPERRAAEYLLSIGVSAASVSVK